MGGQGQALPRFTSGKETAYLLYSTYGSYSVFDWKCGKMHLDPSLSSVFLAVIHEFKVQRQ